MRVTFKAAEVELGSFGFTILKNSSKSFTVMIGAVRVGHYTKLSTLYGAVMAYVLDREIDPANAKLMQEIKPKSYRQIQLELKAKRWEGKLVGEFKLNQKRSILEAKLAELS